MGERRVQVQPWGPELLCAWPAGSVGAGEGAPRTAQHPASHHVPSMGWGQNNKGWLPLRRSQQAQKSLLFPYYFAASSFAPGLLGSFALWRLGARRTWSAAGRLSSVTMCDFGSRFPTHAAPAAFFAPWQAHCKCARSRAGRPPTPKCVAKPRDEGAPCHKPVGLEGCWALGRCCISKDYSSSPEQRRDEFPHCDSFQRDG